MKTVTIILAAVLLVFPLSCHKQTEEHRVRKVVASVQMAAEEKKIASILGHISTSYGDPQGHDYEGIKGLLAYYFFRHQRVSVYIPGIDASVQGTAARATFQAVLTGANGSTGGVLPESLGVYDFDVSLTREEGDWKVITASWTKTGKELQLAQ